WAQSGALRDERTEARQTEARPVDPQPVTRLWCHPVTRFHDRVVLVTGAASGIGRAVAERLGAEDARLFAVDVQAEGLAELEAALRVRGVDVATRRCDVSSEADVAGTIADCVARGGRLDVLVNVAAILRADRLHDLRTADWERVLAVNLTGTFFMCRAALP